jgi:hypothetical protein
VSLCCLEGRDLICYKCELGCYVVFNDINESIMKFHSHTI